MFKFSYNDLTGFTLIELLIVIGITLIISSAVVPIYGNMQVSTQLNENTSLIIQTLREARERSLAGINDSQHGVFFSLHEYTLYQGLSYAGRDTDYDRLSSLDDILSISSTGFTLVGDDIDINFSKGSGVPDNIGTLILNHQVAGARQIVLNALGVVSEN